MCNKCDAARTAVETLVLLLMDNGVTKEQIEELMRDYVPGAIAEKFPQLIPEAPTFEETIISLYGLTKGQQAAALSLLLDGDPLETVNAKINAWRDLNLYDEARKDDQQKH